MRRRGYNIVIFILLIGLIMIRFLSNRVHYNVWNIVLILVLVIVYFVERAYYKKNKNHGDGFFH